MSEGLDVIIVDDDRNVCEIVTDVVNTFYSWGEVHAFTDVDVATAYCLNREIGVAIFIVDVFLGGKSGFYFLDSIGEKFPTAHEDAVIITGQCQPSAGKTRSILCPSVGGSIGRLEVFTVLEKAAPGSRFCRNRGQGGAGLKSWVSGVPAKIGGIQVSGNIETDFTRSVLGDYK